MTYQEVLFQGHKVRVVDTHSKRGGFHRNALIYFNCQGTVLGEAKNGMLLVAFNRLKGERAVCVPASCVLIAV